MCFCYCILKQNYWILVLKTLYPLKNSNLKQVWHLIVGYVGYIRILYPYSYDSMLNSFVLDPIRDVVKTDILAVNTHLKRQIVNLLDDVSGVASMTAFQLYRCLLLTSYLKNIKLDKSFCRLWPIYS